MSFFQRLFQYVVNQVLVESLANSRTFQRFAVKTDATLKKLSKEGAKLTDGELSQQATEFVKVFREEFSKGIKDAVPKPPQVKK